jgi:hypothetical protein
VTGQFFMELPSQRKGLAVSGPLVWPATGLSGL